MRATDAAGNPGPATSYSFVIDTSLRLVAQAPSHSVAPESTVTSGKVAVRLQWSATGGGGSLARYELQQSSDGGSTYAGVALPSLTATTHTVALAKGTKVYRFRVRAIDAVGEVSPWAEGPGFKVVARQESHASIAYAPTWTKAAVSGAWGGYVRHAKAAGSKATVSFKGTSIAWVAPRSSARGRAEVSLDGVLLTTVDLYSGATQSRRIVFAQSGLAAGPTHRLEVRVLRAKNAASTGTRVDADAFVSLE